MPRRTIADLPTVNVSTTIVEEKKQEETETPSNLQDGISSLMQKSLEEFTGKDMQSMKDAIRTLQNDKEKLDEIREVVRESGMEDEVMKKVARGINPHGETMPKRKMMLKAKKEAKRAMNTAVPEEFAALYKGLHINCSRKVKSVTYSYPGLETLVSKMLSTDAPRFTKWGDVIVVHVPAKGHLRNKLIERLFDRDSSLGGEVFVFRYEEDLETEEDLRKILLVQGKVTPTVWELPGSSE